MADARDRGKGLLGRLKRMDATQGDDGLDEQQRQLLQLFEKRNQLKREFGKTLDELERLQAEHAALRDVHARCAARLDGLEAMLSDPQRAQNAVIHFRLDAIRRLCVQMLEQRRAELTAKFEQMEKQKVLDSFKANAAGEQRQLEGKFSQLDSLYQEMATNLKALQDDLRRSGSFWQYFRRRKLTGDIALAEQQVAPVVAERDACLAELERVRDREPPAYKGLSIAAKREINIQLIALAQYLCVQFSENDFAALAHATRDKPPGESHYGTPQECLAMERPLRDALVKLKTDEKRGERLKRRADHLRQLAQYSGNTDTVPDPQVLNRIALSLSATNQSIDAVRGDLLVNVLEQGYWNVDELVIKE